jgi:hypothetical protein
MLIAIRRSGERYSAASHSDGGFFCHLKKIE